MVLIRVFVTHVFSGCLNFEAVNGVLTEYGFSPRLRPDSQENANNSLRRLKGSVTWMVRTSGFRPVAGSKTRARQHRQSAPDPDVALALSRMKQPGVEGVGAGRRNSAERYATDDGRIKAIFPSAGSRTSGRGVYQPNNENNGWKC